MRTTHFHNWPLFCNLLLACVLTGCPGWADLKSADDLGLNGDDDSDTGDDDSAADDDDATEPPLPDDDDVTEPPADDDDNDAAEGDPCDGVDRSEDWDCDGRNEIGDVYLSDPDSNVSYFHAGTVDWTDDADDISSVGYGWGGNADWQFLGINPELSDNESWWEVELDADADGDGDGCTLYRHTLRGAFDSQWADLACEDADTRDVACMFDAGCAIQGIPPGYAMAVRVCWDSTTPATQAERDLIPLAEDDCPTVQ